MNKPVEIVVGRGEEFDPVAGTTECPMPLYAGQSLYLEKTGYGTYDYSKYQVLSTGGPRLVGGGNNFFYGERFYVHFTGLSYGTDQTSYTNGFDFNRVISALFGRIGWREENGIVLNSTNTQTKSGRYFQGFHALVSASNINEIMQDAEADLNGTLIAWQRDIILRALNGVFGAPEYKSQKLLFNRAWPANDQPITNKGQFVGLMLRPGPKADLATQIDSVALYFDSDVTFNMYLYHDAIAAPLSVIEVTATANTQIIVSIPEFVLNYISGNSFGGVFYFGYYQNDLGDAKAYYESYCDVACDSYGWSLIESNQVGNNFDRRNVRMNNVNYGLNFHVSTFRDNTQLIVKKATLFDNLIGLQMAAQVLEQLIFTTRSNGSERVLKEGAEIAVQLDLNGVAPINDSPYKPGLKGEIAKEYKRVFKSFFPRVPSTTVNHADYNR